jgi:putative peptide zinc metalloprotease protein
MACATGRGQVIGLQKSRFLNVRWVSLRGQSYYNLELKYPEEGVQPRYWRFNEKQYFILQNLDGASTLEEVLLRYQNRFNEPLEAEDARAFVGDLFKNGLAESALPGREAELLRARPEPRSWLKEAARSWLWIRVPAINPNRLLGGLNSVVGWLFTQTGVILAMLLALTAVFALCSNSTLIAQRLPAFQQFFGPQNWGYLAVALILTKICHEFGHGLAAKRYGYEVKEMGVMFLIFAPVFYCDVTATHMEPNKWKRIKIALAGMYVEMIIVALCTLLWVYSPVGMVSHLCLAIMFTSVFNTLVFNLNPLMRFDGHYVLAYWWERPELRREALQYFRSRAGYLLFGREIPTDSDNDSDRHWLGIYAVVSALYRWWVIFKIIFYLHLIAVPLGLGGVLAAFAIYTLILQPLYGFLALCFPRLALNKESGGGVVDNDAVAVL